MTTGALGFVKKNIRRGRSIGASVNTVLFTELNPCIHYALYVNFFCGFCLIDICTELVDFVEVWWYSPKYYAQNVQFISSPLFNYYINKCRYYLFLTTITYYYSYAFEHKKKKLYKVQNSRFCSQHINCSQQLISQNIHEKREKLLHALNTTGICIRGVSSQLALVWVGAVH